MNAHRIGRFRLADGLNYHLSSVRELNGIAHQIRQDLPQTPRVTRQPSGGTRMNLADKLQALGGSALSQQLKHIFHRKA